MAASSLNVVRVRLYFDYPSPAVPNCRMCWLLVDLNKCRVVGDLVSVIREKFDYSRKTCLDLFIEDCYLPPSESIYVVRDNDSIRVKAESTPHLNGAEANAPKTREKKRRREHAENVVEEQQTATPKRRKQIEDQQEAQSAIAKSEKKKKKDKKKKRKEEEASQGLKETVKPAPESAVSKPHPEKSHKKPQPSTSAVNGKPAAKKAQETSSDSSESSDEEPVKRLARPKSQQPTTSSTGVGSKPSPAVKPKDSSSSSDSDSVQNPPKKLSPVKSLSVKPTTPKPGLPNARPKPPPKKTAQSSSSDSSDSSPSAERPPAKRTPVRIPQPAPSSIPKAAASAGGSSKKLPTKAAATSSDSDSSSSAERAPAQKPSTATTPKAPSCAQAVHKTPSSTPSTPAASKEANGASSSDSDEEEIKLIIKKPVLNGLSLPRMVASSPVVSSGRGRPGSGEGRFARKSRGGSGGGVGRGNGTPWSKGFRYDYKDEDWKKSRFSDSLMNTSLFLQNPTEPLPPPPPQRDYSALPLLAAPPAVGQKIAFKLLELTENYSPEVSDYKEGKITGFNATTNMLELQLLSRPKVQTEPGKFDLVYENPDGSEVVEYAVTHGSQLAESWSSLLEPRLIVENLG